MSINLMYITNNIQIAKIIDEVGVDYIFVDLEYIGKVSRQHNMNTVISAHSIDDVKNIKKNIKNGKVLVRINPIGEWSKYEINNIIDAGADVVMLPYFKTKREVECFINIVKKRIKTCLLIETMDAIKNIDLIMELGDIDLIHIGLNDLHIERKTTFMFEFLADGSLDDLLNKIKKYNVPFGFGGMARIGSLVPPAEHILTEHYRLGSKAVILSRSFCNVNDYESLNEFKKVFSEEVKKIREYERYLVKQNEGFFEKNKIITKDEVYLAVNCIKLKKSCISR